MSLMPEFSSVSAVIALTASGTSDSASLRRVAVTTKRRRDHQLPVQYRDKQWMGITSAAGPDRVSGGQWSEPYAREYFRCVTDDGMMVWLYRDARSDEWYLHGWWD